MNEHAPQSDQSATNNARARPTMHEPRCHPPCCPEVMIHPHFANCWCPAVLTSLDRLSALVFAGCGRLVWSRPRPTSFRKCWRKFGTKSSQVSARHSMRSRITTRASGMWPSGSVMRSVQQCRISIHRHRQAAFVVGSAACCLPFSPSGAFWLVLQPGPQALDAGTPVSHNVRASRLTPHLAPIFSWASPMFEGFQVISSGR